MPFPQALFVGAVDGRIQAARLGFITESHRMLYGQAIAPTQNRFNLPLLVQSKPTGLKVIVDPLHIKGFRPLTGCVFGN